MSTDQAVTETDLNLDDVVFDTEALDDGETVVGIVEATTEETVKTAFASIASKTAKVATEENVDAAVEATPEEAVKVAIEEPVEEAVEVTPEQTVETTTEEIEAPPVEATAEAPAETTDSADESTPKKAGLLGLIKSPIGLGGIAGLVLAIGAGGFFLVTSGDDPKADDVLELAEAEHGHEDAKADDAKEDETDAAASAGKAWDNTFANESGAITFSGSDALYHTAPVTVSLEPGPDARRLPVSVGLLTARASATALFASGLRVSLLPIHAVESVDFGPYREWELPGLIVTALKTKLEQAYPETEIRAVIIRDFQRVGA